MCGRVVALLAEAMGYFHVPVSSRAGAPTLSSSLWLMVAREPSGIRLRGYDDRFYEKR
jgi:hypothetical protein